MSPSCGKCDRAAAIRSRAASACPLASVRFCPAGENFFSGGREKYAAAALLRATLSGYGSPHLASLDPLRPCFSGRRRKPPLEVMRMDGSADRFLDLIHQLEDFTRSITPDQAHTEFDETTLQLFWMRWPQLSAWAGSLWRMLSEELAGPAAPHDSELHEIGESG